MARKAEPRQLEHAGFKGVITGKTRKFDLWIDGRLYVQKQQSMRDCKRHFDSYATRNGA